MTVASPTNKIRFIGNGAAALFPFSFKLLSPDDLVVVQTTDGTDALLEEGTHYTIALFSDQDASPGGTVTLTGGALPVGSHITLLREVSATQNTDITNLGGFYPQVIEDALDKLTMLGQQAIERQQRTLIMPVGVDPAASAELPSPQIGAVLGWDSAGQKIVNLSAEDLGVAMAVASWRTDAFNSSGVQTVFPLVSPPGSASNCDVTIDGVSQVAGVDFTVAGTVLTLASAPPAGAVVAIRYGNVIPQAETTAWGGVVGTLSAQTDLQTALDAKAAAGHTHAAADVIDFAEAVEDAVAAALVAGANVTIDYDDTAGTVTVSATGSAGAASWGGITGTLSDQTDLQAALDAKATSAHTHTLGNISQSGATPGQIATWNGSAWAPGSPSAGASADEQSQVFLQDDFLSAGNSTDSYGALNWQKSASLTVAGATSIAANHPGVLLLMNPQTTNTPNYLWLGSPNPNRHGFLFGELDEAVFILRYDSGSHLAFVGVVDAAATNLSTTTPAHGAYVGITTAGVISGKAAKGSSGGTDTALGSHTPGDFLKLKIRRVSAGVLGYTVNGGVEVTRSTNVPDDTDPMLVLISLCGGSTSTVWEIDYFHLKLKAPTR